MKRPTETQKKQAGQNTSTDETWNKKYPTIVAYMTDDVWEDGGAREPSTLAVSFRDNACQLALNDKDLRRSMYTTAGTVAEALGLLERALASGVEGWRDWKGGKKK